MQASYKQGTRDICEISLKDSQNYTGAPTRYEQELKRSMHLLKINQDSQIAKTAFELIEKSSDLETTLQHGKWIIALNAIAGSCFLNQRVFSQSEVYDLLTVAVTTSLQGRTKTIDDMIFRIYRDIMANYESSDEKLKIAYPKMIVDVVATLAKGVDTRGNRIPLHNLEHYYQTRKSDVIISNTSITAASEVSVAATATAANIKSIERNAKREKTIPSYKESLLSKDEETELVESLTKITDRSKKDIQASVDKLERKDVLRINDLCKNYSKIEKYSKLIADADNLQKFKTTLQSESGRKLSDHQVQHAASSIRKAKLYIKNVLDGKFTPHGSYGINHTKHNLEYGYLIVGLMQPSRKRTAMK
jgi:hypothetical protein